jgi:ABC-type cobalamin/Fe3+-siderophores transport system ATPase subunit
MLIIEGIRIKNFRVLRDVTLGCRNKQSTNSPFLTSIIAVTGKNGRGKSTLFDAFAFMMIRLQAQACGWILYLLMKPKNLPLSFLMQTWIILIFIFYVPHIRFQAWFWD